MFRRKGPTIVIALLLYLLSTGASYAIFSYLKTPDQPAVSVSPVPLSADAADVKRSQINLSAPKTEICPLNGDKFTKSEKDIWSARRPMGIMIENHVEARPQSGLSKADVVYEAVAEGGITRFLGIFLCAAAAEDTMVGPIRSARTYFMDWVSEYGTYPLYVHVGGANCSPQSGSGCANGAKADALGQIRQYGWHGYNDLNQFSIPFQYMWRDYDRLKGVATEHTMYSTTDKLWEYAADNRKLGYTDAEGGAWDTDFKPWKFKESSSASQTVPAPTIDILFWEGYNQFAVKWEYDAQTNSYKRSNGGQSHNDLNTNKQLTSKNVVVAYMTESKANDGYPGNLHLLYANKGTGSAVIFQEGKAIEGKWSKKTRTDRTMFTDKAGKEIEFVPGQIWVEIVPAGQAAVY